VQRRWALDVTRVVAVVGVAAIHAFGAMVTNPSIRGSGSWWAAVVLDIGFIWVVPVFVMISGTLILERRQFEQGVASFYRRRLVRLAPALVAWSLFYFFVIRTVVSGNPLTRDSLASFLLDGRPYTHLYFLWLIIGLYAVAPVLSAFLREGTPSRALIFAGVVLGVTVFTGSSSSVLGALGQARPLTLLALTQWLPYVGYFLAGWALRGTVLRGWRLAAVAGGTLVSIVICIVQYGWPPRIAILDAIAPVGYYGPLVALASVGVFLSANSLLAGWQPRAAASRLLRELSDSAFGVFLVHFAVMVLMRQLPLFAVADGSLALTSLLWAVVVVISFLLVFGLRRVPFLNRVV